MKFVILLCITSCHYIDGHSPARFGLSVLSNFPSVG
jgi:hypothetical protein